MTFNVHRVVIGRAKYFASCLSSLFKESEEKALNMPEPPCVVAIMLEQLYEFPDSHLNSKAMALTYHQLLQLHKAGDLYLLPDVKALAYRVFTEEFNRAKPGGFNKPHPTYDILWIEGPLKDVITSLALLDGEMDTTKFRRYLYHALDQGEMLFNLLPEHTRMFYKINPMLVTSFAMQAELAKNPQQDIFRLTCPVPECAESWRCSELANLVEVLCPYCQNGSTWERLLLEGVFRRSDIHAKR